jgi:hypothetical protein
MSRVWAVILTFNIIFHIITIAFVLVEMNSSRYDRLNEDEKVVKNKGVFWLLILTGGIGVILFFFPIFLGKLFTRVVENYGKL